MSESTLPSIEELLATPAAELSPKDTARLLLTGVRYHIEEPVRSDAFKLATESIRLRFSRLRDTARANGQPRRIK